MTKLIKLKPILMFSLFLGYHALLILIFILWTNLVPDFLISIGVIFIVCGFLSFYFFWIYLLGHGFNLLDISTGNNQEIRKFGIAILGTLISYIAGFSISFLLLLSNNEGLAGVLQILFGSIWIISIIYIVTKLTKNYRFYDNKPDPRIVDYIITFFLLSFYPFGLMIMHAHLRSILKENSILNDR